MMTLPDLKVRYRCRYKSKLKYWFPAQVISYLKLYTYLGTYIHIGMVVPYLLLPVIYLNMRNPKNVICHFIKICI